MASDRATETDSLLDLRSSKAAALQVLSPNALEAAGSTQQQQQRLCDRRRKTSIGELASVGAGSPPLGRVGSPHGLPPRSPASLLLSQLPRSPASTSRSRFSDPTIGDSDSEGGAVQRQGFCPRVVVMPERSNNSAPQSQPGVDDGGSRQQPPRSRSLSQEEMQAVKSSLVSSFRRAAADPSNLTAFHQCTPQAQNSSQLLRVLRSSDDGYKFAEQAVGVAPARQLSSRSGGGTAEPLPKSRLSRQSSDAGGSPKVKPVVGDCVKIQEASSCPSGDSESK